VAKITFPNREATPAARFCIMRLKALSFSQSTWIVKNRCGTAGVRAFEKAKLPCESNKVGRYPQPIRQRQGHVRTRHHITARARVPEVPLNIRVPKLRGCRCSVSRVEANGPRCRAWDSRKAPAHASERAVFQILPVPVGVGPHRPRVPPPAVGQYYFGVPPCSLAARRGSGFLSRPATAFSNAANRASNF